MITGCSSDGLEPKRVRAKRGPITGSGVIRRLLMTERRVTASIMQEGPVKSFVHTALLATPLNERLASSSAVVLERKARAAGQTRWFYCADQDHLDAVESELSPGSVVSFYFDRRIESEVYSPQIEAAMSELLVRYGEVLVGVISENEIEIAAEVITGQGELLELTSMFDLGARVFYGVFPARDNDGVNAISVVLPDRDGIVRPHPH
jgi:hypothetical protein